MSAPRLLCAFFTLCGALASVAFDEELASSTKDVKIKVLDEMRDKAKQLGYQIPTTMHGAITDARNIAAKKLVDPLIATVCLDYSAMPQRSINPCPSRTVQHQIASIFLVEYGRT